MCFLEDLQACIDGTCQCLLPIMTLNCLLPIMTLNSEKFSKPEIGLEKIAFRNHTASTRWLSFHRAGQCVAECSINVLQEILCSICDMIM